MTTFGATPSGTTIGVCECGHSWDDHGFIDGFDCSPGVGISTGDGPSLSGALDLLVCGGGRDSTSDDPWDHVCGCVLPPGTKRNQRLYAEARA